MGVLTELRPALRSIVRRPGTVVALLITIGIGIGSNVAGLAFISGLLNRPSPLNQEGRQVVSIVAHPPNGRALLSYAEYEEMRQQTTLFDLVAAARENVSTVTVGGRSSVVRIALVTPEAARLFGIPQSAGVVVNARLDTAGLRLRDDEAVDDAVTIDGAAYEIRSVGTATVSGLYEGRPVMLWRVLADASELGDDPAARTLTVFARLRSQTSIDTAQTALDALAAPTRLLVEPYRGFTPELATSVRRLTHLLLTATAAVFLIACANVIVFLLSRASSQSHNISIRVALGAGRGALTRLIFLDSLLLLVPAAAVGALAGTWASSLLPWMLFEQDAEMLVFAPDFGLVLLAGAAATALTVCIGMVPLLENRHDRPAAVLQRQSIRSSRMERLHSSLVIFQVAVSCTLSICAVFLVGAYRSSLRTPAGAHLDEIMMVTTQAAAGFGRPDLGHEYFDKVEQSVAALAGVGSTAWAAKMPGSGASWHSVSVEPVDTAWISLSAVLSPFNPGSLDDVRMPPLAGRMFGGFDSRGRCRVAVVNEEAAAVFDGNALGRTLENRSQQRFEVVGVVAMRTDPAAAAGDPLVYYYPEQGTPTGGASGQLMEFRSPLPAEKHALVDVNVVSASYFRLVGFPLSAGRAFADDGQEGCRVAVLNRQAADLYFAGDAVGGAVIDAAGRRTTIVGVVDERRLRATQRQVQPTMYLPLGQDYAPKMTLLVAGRGTPPPADTLERRMASVKGGIPDEIGALSLDAHLRRTSLPVERIGALLVAAAATNALSLAMLGLYRATTDEVLRRRREIAVRRALGAGGHRLLVLVLARTGRWTLQGIALGLIGAFAANRWLVADPVPQTWPWITGPVILLVGVVLASLLPIRRMLRVDPLTVMRDGS